MFSGTRGVGKTTIARILSKCLNCERGVSATPCGQCLSCQEIANDRFVDLIEVDAASRTGVDDMRDLLNNVQYLPARGRFKVYLKPTSSWKILNVIKQITHVINSRP